MQTELQLNGFVDGEAVSPDPLRSHFTGPGFEVLPLRIFSLVRLGVKPEINDLCTIMFGLTLVFITISQILQKEKR